MSHQTAWEVQHTGPMCSGGDVLIFSREAEIRRGTGGRARAFDGRRLANGPRLAMVVSVKLRVKMQPPVRHVFESKQMGESVLQYWRESTHARAVIYGGQIRPRGTKARRQMTAAQAYAQADEMHIRCERVSQRTREEDPGRARRRSEEQARSIVRAGKNDTSYTGPGCSGVSVSVRAKSSAHRRHLRACRPETATCCISAASSACSASRRAALVASFWRAYLSSSFACASASSRCSTCSCSAHK